MISRWVHPRGVYGIKRNNHGLRVVINYRDPGTPGLYLEESILDVEGREARAGKLGWQTTNVLTPLIIDELEVAFRTFGVRLSDELTIPELIFYQVDGKGGTLAPIWW